MSTTPKTNRTTHAPAPWGVVGLSGNGGPYAIRMQYGLGPQTHYGVQGVRFKEDADFIVRACNAHDELVAALRGLLQRVTVDGCAVCRDGVTGAAYSVTTASFGDDWTAEFNAAEAAIAKAEGK